MRKQEHEWAIRTDDQEKIPIENSLENVKSRDKKV